jgi:hypothetical protein
MVCRRDAARFCRAKRRVSSHVDRYSLVVGLVFFRLRVKRCMFNKSGFGNLWDLDGVILVDHTKIIKVLSFHSCKNLTGDDRIWSDLAGVIPW